MRSSVRWSSLIASLMGLAPGLWGCPGTLKDPAEFEDLPEGSAPVEDSAAGIDAETAPPLDGGCGPQVPSTIFTPVCATSACHGASIRQSGLDLASPINLADLIDKPTVEDADGGLLLINSAHPLESAIYTKVTANPPFGLQMPYGMTPLSAAQIQCVQDWVVAQVGATDAGGD